MRQVPEYFIIGNGRMAKHFCHYLDLLGIKYGQWSRNSKNSNLELEVAPYKRILLLISDNSIIPFIKNNPCLNNCLNKNNKLIIHFSGQLHTQLAVGMHPLMTFSHDLYPLATYKQITFITETSQYDFNYLLPGIENKHYTIPNNLKSFYHSLCVLSGNFTCILWHKFFHELENTFKLPKQIADLYLEQIASNLKSNHKTALTGPLARGDKNTIQANLASLEGDPFQKVYSAFVEAVQHDKY
jgi:2-dehydropantoate 2-reductase